MATNSRAGMLNMRIEPKVKYLAEIAAIDEQRTLSSFVERAIRQALRTKAQNEEEDETAPQLPMWGEGFFDEDEATRFFLLASGRHDLLSVPEQRFIKFFFMHMEHTGNKANLKAFQEFWNTPGIDTSHLSEGGE